MGKLLYQSRKRFVLLGASFFLVAFSVTSLFSNVFSAYAASPTQLTGCLSTNPGLLYSLKSGSAPINPCPTGDPQVSWSTDDITSGWTMSDDAWTYDSATSFTVSGDVTDIYEAGTRVKFTQTTVKYGAVKSSSFAAGVTTVNLIANNDYSIANAAIASPAYSYQSNPRGYPEWFAYTPIVYGPSGSAGSYSTLNLTGYYAVTGHRLTYILEATVSNSGSWSGNILASLPVAAQVGGGTFYYVFGIASNSGDAATNGIKAHNAVITNGNDYIYFEKNFGSQLLQWSDVTPQFRVASQGEVRF